MELLERFTLGELDAFETLFRQHQNAVYGWVVCLVRDPAVAEDLTIETFWRVYRSHARFDPQRSFGAWTRRIATNLALGYLGRGGREVAVPDELLEGEPAAASADPAVQRELRDCIRRAFACLSVRLRAVATLALIEEKPRAEIAAALGISVEAVKSREFRAVRILRKNLQQMGVEP